MREAIGSTWIYQLVVIFILLFVAFLILSLTFSKNYKTKNELINIIEKYEGVNDQSVRIINSYLTQTGNRVRGKCPSADNTTWLAAPSLNSTQLVTPQANERYFYCVNKKWSKSTYKVDKGKNSKDIVVKNKMFYQIKIFFRFNLPIIGNIYTFTVDGTTNDIFANPDIFDRAY
jgi:hypothetical protein